ncbi:cupredoxin domain-containing protein [Alkalibacillus aidingensis]|uniref:cytochrome C oxidase subunit II n=1 Tax=Alkalibacillus aidingensis TaxID=2747607 RepID=UPI00166033D4|nr:cytochrome C oxidase subunit II [Alkalibacillus aidingensis]
MFKKYLLASIFIGVVLALAACGGDDSSEPADSNSDEPTSTSQVDLVANNWDFDQDEYVVDEGDEVTITLTNDEGMHNVAIDGLDVEVDGGDEATFVASEAGEYEIYCSLPCGEGHDEMTTTLVVQ